MKLKITQFILIIYSFVLSNDINVIWKMENLITDVVSVKTLEDPSCEIIAPADGSDYEFGDFLIIAANASDNDGDIVSVSFYVDGELQFIDDTYPYAFTWNTVRNTIGDRLITAIAEDNDGLVKADTIDITVSYNGVMTYDYNKITTYDHDDGAFTQGLVYEDTVLYEGTGLKGQSSLRKVNLKTGEVLKKHDLDDAYFGEGIVIHNDTIIQLTWQDYTGFVYDKNTFTPLDTFYYSTEGWGITHNNEHYIMSDGSSYLYFWDFSDYHEIGKINVKLNSISIDDLNELEFFYNKVFANVWHEDYIAMIDLATGKIIGKIDCEGLLSSSRGVLNGIAYDKDNDRIFVTGKDWPKLFEIELVPVNPGNHPPLILTTAPTSAIEDEEYTYSPIAMDAEDDFLTWSLTVAPGDMDIDQSTGVVTWTPDDDTLSVDVTIKVTDDGNPNLFDEQAFTINITPVNDPPTIDQISNISIPEDDNEHVIKMTGISDGDNNNSNQPLTIIALSSDENLIQNPAVSYTQGEDTGTIAFTPLPNVNGTVIITVTVTEDIYHTSDDASITFEVDILPVNDTPAVNDITDQTITEGNTFSTIILDDYVSDIDNTDAEITWTATGETDLTVSITNRTVTITIPNENWNGEETITFTATDPGNAYQSDNATFTVTAVNDTPVVADIPDRTIAEGNTFTAIILDDYVLDVDNTDSEITWIASGQNLLTVNIDTLTRIATIVIPYENWYGKETIVFTATDPQPAKHSDGAAFTVTPVNDAPIYITIDNLSVQEKSPGAAIGNVTVTDPDTGDTHTFIIDDERFEIRVGKLKLKDSVSLIYTVEPTVSIKITAVDTANLGYEESFTVTVVQTTDIKNGVDISGTSSDWSFTAVPNPIKKGGNRAILFKLRAPRNGNALLKIYDPVANILFEKSGEFPAGSSTVAQWDLKNYSGKKVASGVYLAILHISFANGSSMIMKIAIGIKDD